MSLVTVDVNGAEADIDLLSKSHLVRLLMASTFAFSLLDKCCIHSLICML